MSKIHIDIENGKIVRFHTSGVKPIPITKREKLRRIMTRNHDIKRMWKNLNSPIVFPITKD